MEPMRHYIPLRKDFSNFDEVVERFRDPALRRELAENARRDLIDSGAYTYERLGELFDETLVAAGLSPGTALAETQEASKLLTRSPWRRWNDWRTTRLAYLWTYHRVIFWLVYPFNLVYESPFRLREWIKKRRVGEGSGAD